MASLIFLGVAVVAALALIGTGLYRLVVAFFALEKRTHLFDERPIYAQFAATGARIDTVSREIESLPQLWTRARLAIVAIEQSRSRLRSAARGVTFAARMARAVWNGPKRP